MAFWKEIRKLQPKKQPRRWHFVPYDQLSDAIGPLAKETPGSLGIILIESPWKASRRPYHKQKLALVLSNQRHFALEQVRRGVPVKYLVAEGSYSHALRPLISEIGAITTMDPAESELRRDLESLADKGAIEFLPHEGWLSSMEQFRKCCGKPPPWKMDAFYRNMRRDTGILMQGGKPIGRKYSFDAENRLAWKGKPATPAVPAFPGDPIKEEVRDLILERFSHHPGKLNMEALPATKQDALKLWNWAKEKCLVHFGPYEDAMSVKSRGLFHTRISSLLNIHRLLPKQVVSDVVQLDLPTSSKEGFIRQILGWREFVKHVHSATDGFRHAFSDELPIRKLPGDGGYGRWSKKPWIVDTAESNLDGGAAPSLLGGSFPLPLAYWGMKSGLACLDHVVETVWEEGYSHHITRLMVLSNFATLMDVEPRQLTDWFWAAYTDAYDWVVEPNVLGMGTFALGDLMITKPYVSGAAYINKMSDYCVTCAFNPKKNCPYIFLYWCFLARHESRLLSNPRLRMPYISLKKRNQSLRKKDFAVFKGVQKALEEAEPVTPKDLD